MRLDPIERPRGLLLKLAYRMARRQLGRVPSALSVLYARAPRLARLGYRIQQTSEKGLSLDPALRHLVSAQTSLLNGCGFCADLHEAQWVRKRLGGERFAALADWATSPHFSDRERAALAYCAEITRQRRVDDATFETLRKHFDERQIVELTWLNALANYYNLMAVPLGLESDGLAELARSEAAS